MSDLTKLTVPSRRILTDSVYEAIKELVMDQHIEPGARVKIDDLARRLNVSATPVREALARLEADGLVIKEPLRGYSIAPLLDVASFWHLYEVRLLLEPYAAGKAAAAGAEEQFSVLEEVTEAMRVAIQNATTAESYREYRTFASCDARFHETIALASGNALLSEAIGRLRAHLHLYRLFFHIGIAIETIAEHQQIITALRLRATVDAAAAMATHIERSRNRLEKGRLALEDAALSASSSGSRLGNSRREDYGRDPV